MNKTLKNNIRNAALGLGLLVGGSQLANAQAFPAGSVEDKLMQEVRAEVARTEEKKWGKRIEVYKEPCLDINAPKYQTACLDKQEYTVCGFTEEWANAIDPIDASSKGLCSTLVVDGAGNYTWFRLDGDNKTRSCVWTVEDRDNLDFISLYNKQDPNGGVNNIQAGLPGSKQSDEGTGLGDTPACTDVTAFDRAMRSIRFSFYAQSDPATINFTEVAQFNERNGAAVLNKWVYKIQPDGEGFNGRADYMAKAKLETRAIITDGNIAFDYDHGVLRWMDVNPETAANWYAEAGLLRSRNANGTWNKQKIDNKGWSQSPLMAPINVDVRATDEYNDGPCGHPDQFDAVACPTGAPFTLCFQDGRIKFQSAFDARVNGNNNYAHGLARVQQLSNESGLVWFFTPYNNEGNVKAIDGLGFNGYDWGFASFITNVLERATYTQTTTGATQDVPTTLGQKVMPYHNITLFPRE